MDRVASGVTVSGAGCEEVFGQPRSGVSSSLTVLLAVGL